MSLKSLVTSVFVVGLAGCVAYTPAPVSDRGSAREGSRSPAASESAQPAAPRITASTNGLHTVQRGDTLYAIAFANSLDYRDIASWNQLESADRILVGQVLRLTPPPDAQVAPGVEIRPLEIQAQITATPLEDSTPVLRTPQGMLLPYSEANWALASAPPAAKPAIAPAGKPESSPPAPTPPVVSTPPTPVAITPPAATPPAVTPPSASPSASVESWIWPAEGSVTGRFGGAGGKGIDIVGARNTPVKAVAPGKVVYSGSGLRGYGQLLIVKHSGEFLSAYAHNETILVKEGDTVAAGQKIALMGDSDADRVKLHFEIRRYGKPLDPLNYLPERS